MTTSESTTMTTEPAGATNPAGSGGRTLALALLGLFFLAVYGRYLAGFAPAGGDIVNQYLPYQQLVRGALRQGVMPYWNEMTFCGRPLMADIQVGVLYPPNWLHWVLPLPLSFALLLALHGLWMIAGCWRLGRHWRLHPAAAALGTILYCASPFFTLKASQGIVLFIYVGAWWPWVALATVRLVERPGFGRLAALAVALALSLLAGSPQITYYGWLAACALALVIPSGIADSNSAIRNPQSAIRNKILALAWVAGAFLLALGLTAIQTAQTASFIGTSFERGGPGGAGWDYIVDGSLAPRLLWLLVNPGFLGVGHSEGTLYFGSTLDFAEACFYAPLWVAVVMVPMGVLVFRKHAAGGGGGSTPSGAGDEKGASTPGSAPLRSASPGAVQMEPLRGSKEGSEEQTGAEDAHDEFPRGTGSAPEGRTYQRLMMAGVVAMALGIGLALGQHSPLFALFYKVFPGFNRFRVPARLMIFFFSGEALVAALALNALLRSSAPRPGVRTWAVAGSLVALALVWAAYALRIPLWEQIIGGRWSDYVNQQAQYYRMTPQAVSQAINLHALLKAMTISVGVAGALAALWLLSGGVRRRWAGWLLPALAAAELALLALPFQKTIFFTKYQEKVYPETEVVQALKREHRGGRVLWLDDVHAWTVDQNQPEIYPNRLVMHGLAEARGYDPVNARWIGQWMNLLAGQPPTANPRGFMFVPRIVLPAWLTLMGVETVVSYNDLSAIPGLKAAWQHQFAEEPSGRPRTLTVWRNERFLGLAFAAPGPAAGRLANDENEAMLASAAAASNPATLPLQAVVVTRAMFGEELPALAPAVDARFVVKPGRHDANHFRYEVDYPAPALLCLAQSAYGGWSATIDGEPAEHLGMVSGAFLATVVPAGRHEVVFDFLPDGLAKGRMISLVALVVMVYGLARGRWMEKKKRGQG